MFTKLTTTAAVVLGMTASTAAFAGCNTTANAPSTSSATAVAAAFTSVRGVQVTAIQNPNGSFTVTAEGKTLTVTSESVAFLISMLGS